MARVLFSLFLLSNLFFTSAANAQGRWLKLAPFPEPAEELLGASADGKLYITGGEYQEPGMTATFRSLEACDPAANAWQTLQPMPVSRHGLAGAVVGNRLHMVSGDVQSAGTGVHVHTDSHDAYDFGSDKKQRRSQRSDG